MPKTAETYEGKECHRCGGTTRYVTTQVCVPCRLQLDIEYRKRKQEKQEKQSYMGKFLTIRWNDESIETARNG